MPPRPFVDVDAQAATLPSRRPVLLFGVALLCALSPVQAQRCHFRYASGVEKAFDCFTNACFAGNTDAHYSKDRQEGCADGTCCLENAFVHCARDASCTGFSFPFYGKAPSIHGRVAGLRFADGCERLRSVTKNECSEAYKTPALTGFAACFLSSRCTDENPEPPPDAGGFPRCFGSVPDTCERADWEGQGLRMGVNPLRADAQLGAERAPVVAVDVGNGTTATFDGCFEDTEDQSITRFLQAHPRGHHTVRSCAASCAELAIMVLEGGVCHCSDVILTPANSRVDPRKCGHGCHGEPVVPDQGADALPCGKKKFAAVYSLARELHSQVSNGRGRHGRLRTEELSAATAPEHDGSRRGTVALVAAAGMVAAVVAAAWVHSRPYADDSEHGDGQVPSYPEAIARAQGNPRTSPHGRVLGIARYTSQTSSSML